MGTDGRDDGNNRHWRIQERGGSEEGKSEKLPIRCYAPYLGEGFNHAPNLSIMQYKGIKPAMPPESKIKVEKKNVCSCQFSFSLSRLG